MDAEDQDQIVDDYDSEEDYEPAFIGAEGDDFDQEIMIEEGLSGEMMSEDDDEEEEERPDIPDDSVSQFRGHTDSVYSVAIHPTQPNLVASGGGDDIAFLTIVNTQKTDEEAKEQKELDTKKLEGHTDTVTKVCFNNTGDLLATCGMDATIKIWDSTTGQLVQTLEGPGESLDCCVWHPRGPVIVAGSGDGSVWMWHAKTGAMMNVFYGHSDAVVSVEFTHDGSKIVSASADQTIRIWDPKTGQVLHTIQGGANFHQQAITAMKCHPGQDVIVAGSAEGLISVSSSVSGKVVNTYKDHTEAIEELLFLTFLPCVASASLDNNIHIWDINTLQARSKIQLTAGVTRIVVAPNAPHVIIAGCLDGALHVCDARAGKILKTFTGHTEEILDLAISGSVLASASEDKTVRIWDIQTWLA
eukprot:TRINITY_DN15353_c0_g1_i1.p1 TRINITY_DN15353_c0_g1~~TRINITY_DN15353_c0_g1_i1.p1  ORF type:complete len:415 (-),score=111.00 TRINITY_DN15353_c0_g1_i1:29-1273(-)